METWDISKEITRMWRIRELESLSSRGAFYWFMDEDSRLIADFVAHIARAELFDIWVRKYRDMWE